VGADSPNVRLSLLVHIFVIGIGVQTVVVLALLSGITAVICHVAAISE
jgi:hypothetical protein